MATDTRAPTSDVSETGGWSGADVGTRYTLVDDHPDATGTDKLMETESGDLILGITAFAVPAGATDISLKISTYWSDLGGVGTAYGGIRIKVGGSTYNGASAGACPGSYALMEDTWATNPKTASAWTVDDINGSGVNAFQGMGFYATDASPDIAWASILATVTYTPAAGGAARSQAVII